MKRIGAERPDRADAAALRYLQERHVLSVPFDNLAFHLNESVPHSVEAVEKIVYRRRGGSCFENNTAFALLLQELGFHVALVYGRNYRDQMLCEQIGHVALWVQEQTSPLSEPAAGRQALCWKSQEAWLVDVGHGSNSRTPLRFDLRTPQADAHGSYLLSDAPEGDIDVLVNDSPIYRLEIRPRDAEFGIPSVWWHRTAPESPFATRLMCVLPRERGRATLFGNLLILQEDGRTTKKRLNTESDLREAYLSCFGMEFDRLPSLQISPGVEAKQVTQPIEVRVSRDRFGFPND
ncbi:arylamine N-acetyltransferase family protein [Silvibacterium bohemicum]|uniref:arylamine N-acetyltransferase family protein n=1 Tax=Silvibacterium bohemicum TaxID=1577686 RepID=UPI00160F5824|nr:arylamine N-acetyltransferase [Silvibacterium bohemicum]